MSVVLDPASWKRPNICRQKWSESWILLVTSLSMISVHESTGKSNWYQNSEVSIIPQSLVSVYVYKWTLLWFLVCYFSKSSNYIDNWRRYASTTYKYVCWLISCWICFTLNSGQWLLVGNSPGMFGMCSKVVWNIIFKNWWNNFVLGGANVRGIPGLSGPSLMNYDKDIKCF